MDDLSKLVGNLSVNNGTNEEKRETKDEIVINQIKNTTGVEYSDEQLNILKHRGGMYILACAGSGKALKNGTGVLTDIGYVNIENLKVGDICYDDMGNRQKVLGVYPQGLKEEYRILFSDGSVIKSCKEHLWAFSTDKKNWRTSTLGEIEKLLVVNGANIHIPVTSGVKFYTKDTEVKPYDIGVLIGNMDSRIAKQYNLEREEYDYKVSDEAYGLDLMNGIPDNYKLNNEYVRLKIVEGLIDCIGNFKDTSYELELYSKKLMEDIKFIMETLGLVVYMKTIEINDYKESVIDSYYKLIVQTNSKLSKLHSVGRLDKVWKSNEEKADRTIVNIVRTGKKVPMTCIKVSGNSELFLTENCIVTHNTTVLTHLLAKRILTGEIRDPNKLMCTTYSKAGANEMEERINSLFSSLGIRSRLQVKTLHALYLEILKQVNYPTNVIDNGTRIKYILEACKDANYRLEDEELAQIDTLLSFQINNLMSDSDLVKSYVFNLDNMTESQYTAIRTGYNNRKMQKGQIDFDDMQLYVYSLLIGKHSDAVIEFCNNNWTDYYIDEAQDVSKIQFEILRRIIKKDENIVFIGDDDQCIYQWRGADPSIILNIGGYYDIKKFILSTNYRCHSEIVEHAAVGIVNNTRRSEKTMTPNTKGGKIRICDTKGGSLYDITKYAYTHIKKLVQEEGVNLSDIAVLSRNNQHLSLLNNMLYREGIYCDATNDMKLTKGAMYRDIKNVLNIASNGYNSHITASTLWRMCLYMGTNNSYMIAKIQDNAGLNLMDTIGYMFKVSGDSRLVNWNKNVNIPKKVELQVRNIWYRLKQETIESLALVYKVLELQDDKDRATGLLDLYLTGTTFMYKSQDRSRSILGLVEYTLELIDTIGLNDTLTIFRVTEQYEDGKMVIPGSKITMSTMHGSKGREWKHVILFADDNVSFPSFDGIKYMLENNVSEGDISASIDENRRLHYVAMTRAKEDLTIFANLNNISVYTAEALGVFSTGHNNKEIIRMAEQMQVDMDIIEKVKNIVDVDGSKYKYTLDIKN